MSRRAAASLFYVTGGTMQPDAPSYVERPADAELREGIRAGEYCFILTSRQMGKSSLMARTMRDLREEGVRATSVDLTELGTESNDGERWYRSFCGLIHERLAMPFPFSPWWTDNSNETLSTRLKKFIGAVASAGDSRAVIFVDEIDCIARLHFSNDFFATIRACYNARATEPQFAKISFVLLGVATPSQLISDPLRTPFNIGHEIELGDFTLEEARKIGVLLHSDPVQREDLLQKVLQWTGGHPYLTQVLSKELAERGDVTAVDNVVEELFLGNTRGWTESNLKNTADQLRRGGRPLLLLYRRILHGKQVRDIPALPLHAQLKLAGIAKTSEHGHLLVRNELYRRVFNDGWIAEAMPNSFAVSSIGLAAVSVVLSTSLWWITYSKHSRANELAIAYTANRPFEFRLPDAGYSPVRVQRGGLPLEELGSIRSLAARTPTDDMSTRRVANAQLLLWEFATARATLSRLKEPDWTDTYYWLLVACYYFERGETTADSMSYSNALDILGRLDKANPLVVFNRALVAERMHLNGDAINSWNNYLHLDSSSGFAEEAAEHLKLLVNQ